MRTFKTFHPIINFSYFLFVIGFTMFLFNPVCLMISFVCSLTCFLILKDRKSFKKTLLSILPAMLIMGAMNPLFNHQGITVLTYLPGGNPVTFESVVYGLCTALMIINVFLWFSCYSEVMTSDKFIYLFGRIIPSMSLIISITLRFIPNLRLKLKEITIAQKTIGNDILRGSVVKRAKTCFSILSIILTWSLENSVETADSMKARGYGISGRTAFSIYNFNKKDYIGLIFIFAAGIYVLFGSLTGKTNFIYFPEIMAADYSILSLSVYLIYFALSIYPVIIECLEAKKWKSLKSKI